MKENGMKIVSFSPFGSQWKKRLENWRCIISPNCGENEKEKGVWMVDDSSTLFFYTSTTE